MEPADREQLVLTLRELLGDRFTPGDHDDLIGTAAPRTAAELRKLILCTSESNVALVPRGAGSSPYGGGIATHGLVVTFQCMDRILHVDLEAQTAKVEPGVVWRRLIEHLRPLGLMPRVYPSSAGFSTVGGFVAQGGAGVGSFQYGPIQESVAAVRMMSADGQTVTLHGPVLDLAVGTEGRTGMLLEILLRLQPRAAMEPLVAVFGRVDELEGCLAELTRLGLPLWSIAIMDRAAVDLQARKASSPFALPQGRCAALFSFRSEERQRVLPRLRGVILASGGQITPGAHSHDAWIKGFMSLQALDTTPVPMRFRVPVGRLGELLRTAHPELRQRLAFEALVVDAASWLVMSVFLTKPPRDTAENLAIARELLRLVKLTGGHMHATGRFFQDEAIHLYGAPLLNKLTQFRLATDPNDRLNPGVAFDGLAAHLSCR